MARKPVTVVIADDQTLVAEALAQLVRSDESFEVVAVLSDGDAALTEIRRRAPDVAVLEVAMPRRSGLDVTTALRRPRFPTRVLFLTGRADRETLDRCIDAGGHGFVSKTEAKDALLSAIATVASGRCAFPLTDRPESSRNGQRAEPAGVLSPQEVRVLSLAANGLSTAAIASELFIADTTAKTHLRHAARKLGVRGKTAACVAAVRHGLI